jgi:hypothetical protein
LSRYGKSEPLKNIVHADEWGYAEGKSEIVDCMMELEGKVFKASSPTCDAFSIYAQTEEKDLKPDKTANLRARWVIISPIVIIMEPACRHVLSCLSSAGLIAGSTNAQLLKCAPTQTA